MMFFLQFSKKTLITRRAAGKIIQLICRTLGNIFYNTTWQVLVSASAVGNQTSVGVTSDLHRKLFDPKCGIISDQHLQKRVGRQKAFKI
jgi:hypothetical protein